jgi:hypothetical protein
MIDHKVTDAMGQGVMVSAIAPDEIELGANQPPRLNLFLYQATPNAAWRNADFPAYDARGSRVANPPLALDLHYMLTAYGAADLQAEVLLGYAMLLFHETPVLTRDAIRRALDPPPNPAVTGSLLPTIYQSLRAADLANQMEQIKITPQVMNTEELSKLWTAIQSHYRPTATYLATVALIQPVASARAALPVLSRGPRDPVTHRETGYTANPSLISPFPILTGITLAGPQAAAQLGETVTFAGLNLDGIGHVLELSNMLLGLSRTITPATTAVAAAVGFPLPNDAANYPAGVWGATIHFTRGADPAIRRTNQVALAIAPQITGGIPVNAALDANGNLTLTPTCTPQIQVGQRASLILGEIETLADPFTAATNAPTFRFLSLPPGTYWVRLRVDGVDSNFLNYGPPPAFTAPQIMVTP